LNILPLADRSVAKFKGRLVPKGFSQIQGHDYDEIVALPLSFNSLHLLLSIITANNFIPQQLDVIAGFLYGKLKALKYMHRSEGYTDSNNVAHLKMGIYGFIQSRR
jgi:hypothetical protein